MGHTIYQNEFGGAVGYWRHDLEDEKAILKRSMQTYSAWRDAVLAYDHPRPAEVDPREWFDIESQGNLGSCAGNAVASCAEYCYMLRYGPEIQLSRMWAYLTAQQQDNINGDSGSTLDGCGKATKSIGICLESSFPYPTSYSKGLAFYKQNKATLEQEAANYKLNAEVPITTWGDCVDFIATTGPVQTGIMWGSSMDVGWEIKNYSPGSGGHSTVFCGYLKVNGWPDGIGLLMKNSWGTGWGREGWALVHRNAFEQMLRGQWNLFVGRSDSASPEPKPKPDI